MLYMQQVLALAGRGGYHLRFTELEQEAERTKVTCSSSQMELDSGGVRTELGSVSQSPWLCPTKVKV